MIFLFLAGGVFRAKSQGCTDVNLVFGEYQARSLYAMVADTFFVNDCNTIAALSQEGNLEAQGTEMKIRKKVEGYGSFAIRPNPVKESLQLSYQIIHDAHVSIYDLYGREVLKSSLSKEAVSTTIDASHLASGIYLLRVYDTAGQELFVQKVIISN